MKGLPDDRWRSLFKTILTEMGVPGDIAEKAESNELDLIVLFSSRYGSSSVIELKKVDESKSAPFGWKDRVVSRDHPFDHGQCIAYKEGKAVGASSPDFLRRHYSGEISPFML